MAKPSKYDKLGEEPYYETPNGRGIIRVSENKETNNKTISFSNEAKTKEGKWVQRRGKFFAVPFFVGTKFINILIKFASKFGIKIKSENNPEDIIKNLKEQLDQACRQRDDVENVKKQLEANIQLHLDNIKRLREEVIKNNLTTFSSDIQSFENLLLESENESLKEEALQKFLKAKPWIFSPEYINITPKKPVGSKSIFDFYLEDYKGQGTVVELEKPSDMIFSKKESLGISQKCGESLGQLMRYTEDTIAYSSNKRTSEKEQIDENKPIGFLIIGRTKTNEEIQNLKIINHYLHSIQILSYDLLLLKAKRVIEGFKKNETTK